MGRIIRDLALLAVAVLGAFSCQKDDAETLNNNEDVGIYATTTSVESKIGFSESSDGEAIELTWSLGDAITIYDASGSLVGDLECADTSSGKFTPKSGVELTDGASYTAIYPASTESDLDDAKSAILDSLDEQNGDEINSLDDSCYLLTDFTYRESSTTTVPLVHQLAVMTFTFTSTQTPAKLVFGIGSDEYTVNYTSITADNGYYTSYIMMNTYEATSGRDKRTLTFSLYNSTDQDAYDIREDSSTSSYDAGYRYTSAVSDLAPTIWLGSGSGTESDPYQVSSADDLRMLATMVNGGNSFNGKYIVLTQSISLGGEDSEFTAIGSDDNYFRGTFDGRGYTISDLYINKSSSSYQGLFGYIHTDGVVKNLCVSGEASGNYCVGGIVGINYGSIINCCSSVEVSGTYSVGGIAGENYGSIINCYNTGAVSGSYNIGGLVGCNYAGSIINCYNIGDVSGDTSSAVGGVVGSDVSSFGTLNCYRLEGCVTQGTESGIGTEINSQSSFIDTLNDTAALYNAVNSSAGVCEWKTGGDYPTLDFGNKAAGGTSFSSGDGSEDTPYMIGSKSELELINTMFNFGISTTGVYFELSGPIDLEGEASNPWIPIGGTSTYFEGVFDGGGYTISGLYINAPDSDYQGLFGYAGYDTVIKDLTVSGEVIGGYNTAGVVGYNCGTITGCTSNVEVSGTKYVGGITGQNSDGTISNSCNKGEIIGTYSYPIGGIAGYSRNGKITNCYNTGVVESISSRVGGIVGEPSGTTIANCYNTGSISGSSIVGGITGYPANIIVTNCYNIGSVSGTPNSTGSIAGYITSTEITNCYWASDVMGAPSSGVGYGTDDAESMLIDNMKLDSFVTRLNGNAYTYNQGDPSVAACAWAEDTESANSGCPLLDFDGTPTE